MERRIPKEHDERLHEAGRALVRGLEGGGVSWQRIVLAFEVPPVTDKFVVRTMDAQLDDASKVHVGLFTEFIRLMQELFDNAGPEPWRSGRFQVTRGPDGQPIARVELR